MASAEPSSKCPECGSDGSCFVCAGGDRRFDEGLSLATGAILFRRCVDRLAGTKVRIIAIRPPMETAN